MKIQSNNLNLKWQHYFKGKPVSLITGIICKDGIVLAADSQTTKGTAKQLGANKISVVEFQDGKVLVAESGSAALSQRAIQVFQQKAFDRKMENAEMVAKVAEEAVREIRTSQTSLHPDCKLPEDWQDFFSKEINYFELMVAYYFEDEPCLYKFNPLWCIPIRATSYFMTSGIASDLANYILSEHTEPRMKAGFASVIAVKVIEDAADYVEGCGRPARVAIIRPPVALGTGEDVVVAALGQSAGLASKVSPFPKKPRVFRQEPVVIFPTDTINEIAEIIGIVERRTQKLQNRKIHAALHRHTLRVLKGLGQSGLTG